MASPSAALSFDEFLPQFRTLFPEFDSVPDATVEIYYNQALTIWGVCGNALLYLVAHLIALDQSNGIGTTGATVDGGNGEHTSEKIGDIEVALKTMADSGLETYYTSTPYGRRFLAFKKACPSYRFSARVMTQCQ